MSITTVWEEEEAAIALLEADDPRALAAFEALLRADARSVTAHFHLALIWRKRGDLRQALRLAKRTLLLSPDETNARLNIGVIYLDMGRVDKAIEYYKKELALDPENPDACYNLGHQLFEKRQWQRAARYLQKSFDLNHRVEALVLDLAICYRKTRQLEAEEALYVHYLERYPGEDDAWALQNLGAVFYDRDDWQSALKYLEAAQKLEPDEPFIQQKLQQTRERLARSSTST